MGKKTIVWLSDWNLSNSGEPQSGYSNISAIYCKQLSKDYNIIAMGPSYRRVEHNYLFSLTNVPFPYFPSALASINRAYPIHHMVVCLDIPQQRQLAKVPRGNVKYSGIFAVEADPLYTPWAMDLASIDYKFSISEFGKQECVKAGIDAQHLVVPVDRKLWYPRTLEEKASIKEMLGVKDKTLLFVNADGNERKNTSMVMEALKKLNEWGKNNFYLIVLTQVKSPINWDLGELAMRYDLSKQVSILDKGLSQEELRRLYAGADFFLNVTKAEGMSYPVLEAMSVGTPVIATDATAMADHLQGGKNGIGLKADFIHIDVFGNTNRYYVFPQTLAENLAGWQSLVMENAPQIQTMVENASNYIDWRNAQNSVDMLRNAINE